jgi:capsular polysaccharide biosynthesis protein
MTDNAASGPARLIEARPAAQLGRVLGTLPSGGAYRRVTPAIHGPTIDWIVDLRKQREDESIVAPDCQIVSFKNAVAVAGVIFTQEGTIVRESLINRDGEQAFLGMRRTGTPNVFAVEDPFPAPLPMLYGPHVLLAQQWDSNYGHWVVEGLPRMAVLRDVMDFAGVKFVLNATSPEMLRVCVDSLRYYCVSPNQLVMRGAEVQPFEELIYPTPMTEQPWVKAPLAIRALENLANRIGRAASAPARLFLGRPDGGRRELLNRAAVRDFFLARGYEEIIPAGMTFVQQVQAFSQARHVVGVMGAECANLAFAPAGVRFLGLAPDEMQDDFFWDLVSHKQGRYVCLHGEAQDRTMQMNAPFTVDMAELQALAAVFDGG